MVDHKVPHDRYPGSFFDMRNLWTLCARDNNSKRDLSADEWLAALRPASAGIAGRDGRLHPPGRTEPVHLRRHAARCPMTLNSVCDRHDHTPDLPDRELRAHALAGRGTRCRGAPGRAGLPRAQGRHRSPACGA